MSTRTASARRATTRAIPAVAPPPLPAAVFETSAAASDADVMLAVRAYFATVDGLLAADAALAKIARDSIDPIEQSRCFAESLRVKRELELLKNKRRSLMDGTARLNPPSEAMVAESQDIAASLAQVLSSGAQFAAVVALVDDALALFGRVMA